MNTPANTGTRDFAPCGAEYGVRPLLIQRTPLSSNGMFDVAPP